MKPFNVFTLLCVYGCRLGAANLLVANVHLAAEAAAAREYRNLYEAFLPVMPRVSQHQPPGVVYMALLGMPDTEQQRAPIRSGRSCC